MTTPSDSNRPGPLSPAIERVDQRTLRRRQYGLLRSALLTLSVIVLLICLLVANRDEVTIRGCKERMEMAANVLQRREVLALPPTTSLPDTIAPYDDEAHRAAIEGLRGHALYNLLYHRGAITASEIGVCACRFPHARLVGESGRWVIIYRRATHEYSVQWLSEVEYDAKCRALGLENEDWPRAVRP